MNEISTNEHIDMDFWSRRRITQTNSIYSTSSGTATPTLEPTVLNAEELHEEDAYAAVLLNVILIICVLLAYFIKEHKIYFLPESVAAIILGIAIGALVSFFLNDVTLYQFSPEFFFFVLLPPIIFEAGYSLEKKSFFENIGTIVLFAILGTIISTFVVGFLTYYFAKQGYIHGVSTANPMEALLFGSLISAVDPVATLSIMNNPELRCNKLLYSLVFGESVLNDAVAIVLFNTFRQYYDPDSPELSERDVPKVIFAFFSVALLSVIVGALLGLLTSFIYKNTSIRNYSNLESTLLFLFCYLCYATAESLGLSGVMALFFNGIVLSHYNSDNLSGHSRHAAEQIFATLATVSETIVFLYMGMGVFTGKFTNWNVYFSLYAMLFCIIGRFLNIFPLSCISNIQRKRKSSKISLKMQMVLWFAGLRGAIAYALAENMPGENRTTYITTTLSICLMTTVVCGGFTERVLHISVMKDEGPTLDETCVDDEEEDSLVLSSVNQHVENVGRAKSFFLHLDRNFLQPYFGGKIRSSKSRYEGGNYELGVMDSGDDPDTYTD